MDNLRDIASEIRRLSSDAEERYEFPGMDSLFSILEKRENDALSLDRVLDEGRKVADLVQEAITVMRIALDEDSERALAYPGWNMPGQTEQSPEQMEGETKTNGPIFKLVKRR